MWTCPGESMQSMIVLSLANEINNYTEEQLYDHIIMFVWISLHNSEILNDQVPVCNFDYNNINYLYIITVILI